MGSVLIIKDVLNLFEAVNKGISVVFNVTHKRIGGDEDDWHIEDGVKSLWNTLSVR